MIDYQINFLEQTKSNLISTRQAYIEGELGEIQNDYVVSPELPAQNTQTINGIYMDFLETGGEEYIISNNYATLLALASQCPAAGGQSVYRARAMLALINDSIEYNDAIVCLQSGIYREAYTENIFPIFIIVPNPANSSVEIVVEKITGEICKVEIANILGQELIIKDIDCNKKSHQVDVSNLNNGIYLVKFFVDNEIIDAQKLIIMR
jgi:hypothetical protein